MEAKGGRGAAPGAGKPFPAVFGQLERVFTFFSFFFLPPPLAPHLLIHLNAPRLGLAPQILQGLYQRGGAAGPLPSASAGACVFLLGTRKKENDPNQIFLFIPFLHCIPKYEELVRCGLEVQLQPEETAKKRGEMFILL